MICFPGEELSGNKLLALCVGFAIRRIAALAGNMLNK
jgi:hypothetical protein